MNKTRFDYLLNAFEAAAQSDAPAEHGYAEKRQAMLAYVRGQENRALSAAPPAPQPEKDVPYFVERNDATGETLVVTGPGGEIGILFAAEHEANAEHLADRLNEAYAHGQANPEPLAAPPAPTPRVTPEQRALVEKLRDDYAATSDPASEDHIVAAALTLMLASLAGDADAERLRAAEARVWPDGLTFGCDAAEHLADEILALRAKSAPAGDETPTTEGGVSDGRDWQGDRVSLGGGRQVRPTDHRSDGGSGTRGRDTDDDRVAGGSHDGAATEAEEKEGER